MRMYIDTHQPIKKVPNTLIPQTHLGWEGHGKLAGDKSLLLSPVSSVGPVLFMSINVKFSRVQSYTCGRVL